MLPVLVGPGDVLAVAGASSAILDVDADGPSEPPPAPKAARISPP
jgi:hypothetical protein